MNRRLSFGDRKRDKRDRRRDKAMEAKVEMAVLFQKVFSHSAAQQYMLVAGLDVSMRLRIMERRYRRYAPSSH